MATPGRLTILLCDLRVCVDMPRWKEKGRDWILNLFQWRNVSIITPEGLSSPMWFQYTCHSRRKGCWQVEPMPFILQVGKQSPERFGGPDSHSWFRFDSKADRMVLFSF